MVDNENEGMRKLTKIGRWGFDFKTMPIYTKIGFGIIFSKVEMDPPSPAIMIKIEFLFYDILFLAIKIKQEEEDDRD